MIAVLTPSTRPAVSSSGPPELPGLSGAVCLDHAVDQAIAAAAQAATERRDNAGRHRRFEAERVADRDGELADARRDRAFDRKVRHVAAGRRERARVDFDQREVGRRIVAHHARIDDLARRRAHLDLARGRRGCSSSRSHPA